jgi:hypothetical protein
MTICRPCVLSSSVQLTQVDAKHLCLVYLYAVTKDSGEHYHKCFKNATEASDKLFVFERKLS